MSVVELDKVRSKNRFSQLLKQYADVLIDEGPNNGFKAVSIYKGWQHDVPNWLLMRLDHEVHSNKDLIKITDIKHNHINNQLSVNYVSIKGQDYDEMIDILTKLENKFPDE